MPPAWVARAGGAVETNTRTPQWAQRAQRSKVLKRPAAAAGISQEVEKRGIRTWRDEHHLRSLLEEARLPNWWILLVLSCAVVPNESLIAGVEMFSGKHELSTAFCQLVGTMLTFEVLDDPRQDIMTDEGLRLLLRMILRIVVGGLLWIGTPAAIGLAFPGHSQSDH